MCADAERSGPRALLCALLFAAWCCARPAAAELPVPPLRAHVNDGAGLFDVARRDALEARLAAYETERGTQLVVLTVRTTDGEPIASYALRVAEAWRLGRKGVDDGALLVVATEDRRVRIEVGYGLEGAVSDATAKRIIDETLLPAFRAGDYAGGIEAAMTRLMEAATGEALPPPAAERHASESPYGPALFFALFFAAALRGAASAALRALGAAAAAAAVTFLVTRVLVAAAAAAVAAAVLAVLLGGAAGGGRRWVSHRRYGGFEPGGWHTGSWGGGRFGGGGGRFGGGGASGSW